MQKNTIFFFKLYTFFSCSDVSILQIRCLDFVAAFLGFERTAGCRPSLCQESFPKPADLVGLYLVLKCEWICLR